MSSLQPTLYFVLKLCVCLSSLYDQYVPFLDCVVLYVVVASVTLTQVALRRGVERMRRLATEPPQHTHSNILGGGSLAKFLQRPRDADLPRNYYQ